MSFGVLFPGQGSQFVGMGADLFDALPELLGERSDTLLGWPLRDVCLDGPEERLTRTEHAQPALFALSYALWTLLADRLHEMPAGAAGHSLGEYTALTAAGAMTYDDALAIVSTRGRAMGDAADLEDSAMAALIGIDEDSAADICERRIEMGGRLQIANLNGPGQVVVAGSGDDIAWLLEGGRDLGVRRVIPLNVAGAFHSSFMSSAQPKLLEGLDRMRLTEPSFPVWSNTTARPHESGALVATLVAQVVSPVLFGQSLIGMSDAGIDTFVHVGPGDVTAGMARRTVETADVLSVSSIDDIPPVTAAIGTMTSDQESNEQR